MTTPSPTLVKLVSADGIEYDVEKDIAEMSSTIKDMISEIGIGAPVPVSSVKAKTLTKVIEWATYHKAHPEPAVSEADRYRTDNIGDWDKTFMQVDLDLLFMLMMAANYLDIRNLLDLVCKTMANMIKGRTPEEVRTTFTIPPTSEFYKPPAAAVAVSSSSSDSSSVP